MIAVGRRAVVAVWIAGAAAGGLVSCSSGGGSGAPPSVAEVRALLVRQSAAVVHHDRTAFARDLASGDAVGAFRARQLQVFANLVQLPLASWTYRYGLPTDSPEAQRAATRRYGTGALIVEVNLRYAVRGSDRAPATRALYWTFLRHHGRTVVAGDTDLSDYGGGSWRGPWDFGRLHVARAPHVLVVGHAADLDELPVIAGAVSGAVPAVTAVWGTGWSRAVTVLVPASSDELAAEAGDGSPVTADTVAAAVSDGVDPVSGVVIGQRLVVNAAAFARLSAVGRQIVLRHEVTHIASAAATSDGDPRWVVEGFADYVGNLHSGQSVPVAASELRALVRRSGAPKTLPADAGFTAPATAATSYEGAWLACRLIAAHAGPAGLVRFYRLVGAAANDGAADPVAGPLATVLHDTPAAFTAQWRRYLITELHG